ncbi:hypothetical protein BGX26_003668 [Mortierella sp. AD094]|nr:hypothetical protein BGX26_003668 [Mortierella sp. AD094]
MAYNGLYHDTSFPLHPFSKNYHQLLLTLALVFSKYATAQAPLLVINPAYATIDEKTLYIQGGSNAAATNATSNQFFALDLDKSNWNTANPPWRQLSTGSGTQVAPTDYSHSMTVINNQQSLLIWGSLTGISTYDTVGGSWSVTTVPTVATRNMNGLHAVTDPSTGLVYIPAGANQGQNMMLYNPSTGASQILPIPSAFGISSVTHYGAVWSTFNSTILMYGGYYQSNSNTSNPNLFEYTPSSAAWTLVTTSGTSPGDVNGHCMVPAYNGTKVVLFGGETTGRTPLGSIYILDVSTMTWEKGTDIDPSLNRNGMACSVAGDNFIAWGGGQLGKYVSALETPVIYNLKSSQWTTQFILPVAASSTTGPSTNSGTSSSPKSSSSTSAAMIGGIAAAAAIVVIGILFLVFRRYRSSKDRTEEENMHSLAPLENNHNLKNGKSKDANLEDNDTPYVRVPFNVRPQSQQVDRHSNTPAYIPGNRYSVQQDEIQSWDTRNSLSIGNSSLYPLPDASLYQQERVQSYQQPVVQPYRPPVTQSYHHPATQPYQPRVTQPYQSPVSQSYLPQTSQPYEPFDNQLYEPHAIQPYEPHAIQSYEQLGDQALQSPGIQANPSADVQSHQPPMQELPVPLNAPPPLPKHRPPNNPQLYTQAVSREIRSAARNPHEIQNLERLRSE